MTLTKADQDDLKNAINQLGKAQEASDQLKKSIRDPDCDNNR